MNKPASFPSWLSKNAYLLKVLFVLVWGLALVTAGHYRIVGDLSILARITGTLVILIDAYLLMAVFIAGKHH
ncbi:hypothetical protein ACQUXI_003944 [Cronobacter turicensis]|nr:hypothetical protein [Klebsiella pneumoniae]